MSHTANKEKTTDGAAAEISTPPVTGESNPATVEKEAAVIIAEAKAQAAIIIDEAEKAAKGISNAAETVATDELMIPVRLFRDGEKYKDDVFVGVNGKPYKIQRGVTVEVPPEVYEALMNSMDQDQATADLIARETRDFKSKADALGI